MAETTENQMEPSAAEKPRSSTRVAVLLVVVALFAGILAAKLVTPTGEVEEAALQPGGTLASVRNDASADYAAAVKTGKPIYVLFHSLS